MLTNVLEDLLRKLHEEIPTAPGSPRLVLATLENEEHGLGLLLVSPLARLGGFDTVSLGTRVPIDEIVKAVSELQARAVGISVSAATGGVQTDREVAELRQRLPDAVHLLVGGQGARGVRRGPRNVDYAERLDTLQQWIDRQFPKSRPA